jgi:hypothetical protein
MESRDPIDDFSQRWNALTTQSGPKASASHIWNMHHKRRQQGHKQIFAFGLAAFVVIGLTLFTLDHQLKSMPPVESALNQYEPFNLYVYEP